MENQTVAEPSAPKEPETRSQTPPPTFVGNTNDLVPIVAATTAGISGLCCLSFGYLIYCLPIVGIVLGAVALLNADAAINPDRTRRWGWLTIGVSGGVLAGMFLLIVFFVLFYAALIAGITGGIPLLPTPTPLMH